VREIKQATKFAKEEWGGVGLLDEDEIMTRTFGSVTYFCIRVGFQLKFSVAIRRFKKIG
jgi:hypothetical protein